MKRLLLSLMMFLFLSSFVNWYDLTKTDLKSVDNQIKIINKKYTLDSKQRQNYIDSLYNKKDKKWSKNEAITSQIIKTLEEQTNTVYLSWFKCGIVKIESMIWGGRVSSDDNQIIGINLNCKNISKNKLTPSFGYTMTDKSSSTSTSYTYTNAENFEELWFKSSMFFTNPGIKSEVFDSQKVVNPWQIVKWWMLSEIPKSITKLKYCISYSDSEFQCKRVTLKQKILKSKEVTPSQGSNDECLASAALVTTDAMMALRDCYAIKWWYISEWISENAFNKINDELYKQWKPDYRLQINDSNLWSYYCKETIISQSCVWIHNWKVDSQTTIYY